MGDVKARLAKLRAKVDKEAMKAAARHYRKELTRALLVEEAAVWLLHLVVPLVLAVLATVGVHLALPVPTRGEMVLGEKPAVTERALVPTLPSVVVKSKMFDTPMLKKGA